MAIDCRPALLRVYLPGKDSKFQAEQVVLRSRTAAGAAVWGSARTICCAGVHKSPNTCARADFPLIGHHELSLVV